MRRDRRTAERAGRRAEALAALWLRAKGYRILDRRARTPCGEIDLVARRGRLIAFVEVKARDTLAAALEAVTPMAQDRIVRAAEAWLADHPGLCACETRLDLIAMRPRRLPRHLRDAWRPDFAAWPD